MDVNKVFIWLMLVISISADDYSYNDYADEYEGIEVSDCEPTFLEHDFR